MFLDNITNTTNMRRARRPTVGSKVQSGCGLPDDDCAVEQQGNAAQRGAGRCGPQERSCAGAGLQEPRPWELQDSRQTGSQPKAQQDKDGRLRPYRRLSALILLLIRC